MKIAELKDHYPKIDYSQTNFFGDTDIALD